MTTPGHIYGASPWTRDAVRRLRATHPETLDALEARIPERGHITIGAGRAPGPWNAYLVIDRITVAEAREHVSVAAAAHAVLYAWEGRDA